MWSWYTSVYGGVNFRPQIVHSHLSIDISNYRPGSYNTWVNCHKTSALLYSLYRLLVRITGESSCAIQFDFLNQGPQVVYLWHGIDGAINILLMRDLQDARYKTFLSMGGKNKYFRQLTCTQKIYPLLSWEFLPVDQAGTAFSLLYTYKFSQIQEMNTPFMIQFRLRFHPRIKEKKIEKIPVEYI